jgi:two-component system response regulator FixJ
MPDMSGLDLLRELRSRSCMVPVIVMTGHGDIQLAVEAMKSGAIDFLEKPFDDERVLTAVRSALEAKRAQDERFGRRHEIEERLASLSQRERQVLDGLVAGLPNKTIAHDLGISPRTVEVYRANVMTKMQAGSLSELVRMVLLVQPA